MGKYPIALELYSVRHDLTKDFLGTLKEVKAMGYDGVEFAGGFVHSPEIVKSALMETGLEVVGWHTPWAMVQDGVLEATIAYNRIVGNKRIIVPGLPGDLTSSREGWLKAAAHLNKISARLAKDGMYTGYHNHAIEFAPLDGEMPWDTFFGNTDPRVIMQIDTGNCLHGNADPAVFLKKYPGRALSVHLKPFDKAKHFDTMIGEDSTDWKALLEASGTAGGAEVYIIEYESEKLYAPLEGVKRCLDAVRAMESKGWIV